MKSNLLNKQKDVAFVLSPYLFTTNPQIGVAYLIEYLRKNKIYSEVIDINTEFFSFYGCLGTTELFYWTNRPGFYEKIFPLIKKDIKKYAERICSLHIPIIGFSIYQVNLFYTQELIKEIRAINPEILIICGGPLISTIKLLKECIDPTLADVFIVGAGEEAIYKII